MLSENKTWVSVSHISPIIIQQVNLTTWTKSLHCRAKEGDPEWLRVGELL